MKNIALLATVLLSSLFMTQASAEIILGAKVGILKPDLSNAIVDNGTNLNFQLGYEFLDLVVADVALELEVSSSQSDSKVDNFELDFESQGVYASVRTIGPIYVIGRAGMAKAEYAGTSDTAPSIGVGVGFSTGIRWELEYTTYEIEEVEFNMITFGLSF